MFSSFFGSKKKEEKPEPSTSSGLFSFGGKMAYKKQSESHVRAPGSE